MPSPGRDDDAVGPGFFGCCALFRESAVVVRKHDSLTTEWLCGLCECVRTLVAWRGPPARRTPRAQALPAAAVPQVGSFYYGG